MRMKGRPTHCCQSGRCAPIGKRNVSDDTDRSGGSSVKRPSLEQRPSASRRPSTSPQRRTSSSQHRRTSSPSINSQRRPSSDSEHCSRPNHLTKPQRRTSNSPSRRTKHAEEHASCVNLMSETLLSVAAKLEKVFNGSENSYPKVKRVYVIRFDGKGSASKKRQKKYTRVLYERKPKGKELTSNMKRAARSPTWRSSSSGLDDAPSFEDKSGDALKHLGCSQHTESPHSWESGGETQSEPKKAYGSLGINRTGVHTEEDPKKQCDKIKMSKKGEIADIFGAIFNQIGNVHPKRRTASSPKRKTLSQIIESNESLVSSNYTIPLSMVNKDTVDVLQALIDRKNKQKKTRKSLQKLKSSRPFNSMECFVMRHPWSYQADDQCNIGASSSVASGPICRICHERLGTLVRPCRCRGSMAYVHVECLQMWLTEKGINHCEVCNYVFRVIHVPEYKLIPSIGFWYKFAATNQQRKRILVDLTLAVILLPVLIFFTLFARSWNPEMVAADLEDDVEYDEPLLNIGWMLLGHAFKLLSFLLNLLYVGAVIVRINHHLATWLSWYVNKNVTVVLEDRRHGSTGHGDDGRRSPE